MSRPAPDGGAAGMGGTSPDAPGTRGADGATSDGAAVGGGDAGRSFATDRAAFGLGGTSRCAGSGVLLCEDFEKPTLDTTTWSVQTWGKGSATIDTTRAARGTRSLHITQPSAVSKIMLRETKTFATTGNHFFGRFFLYMPYAPPKLDCPGGTCTNLVHWTAASAGGSYLEGGKTYHPDVRAVGAVNQRLLVNLDGGPKPEVGISDANAPTGYGAFDDSHKNEWMCFEFEYAGEGAAAEVRVYWDGREHPGLHYSTAQRGDKGELWPIPKYDYLDFGFTHYQDYGTFAQSFDAWLDEIAVDGQRIGCVL